MLDTFPAFENDPALCQCDGNADDLNDQNDSVHFILPVYNQYLLYIFYHRL